MDETMKRFVGKLLLMYIGAWGGILPTLYLSFVMDEKTTTIELKYPFIAEKSSTEFYMNLTLQWIVYLHSTCIYFGIELLMLIFENFAGLSSKLIRNDLIEMNNSTERRKISKLQLRSAFRSIFLQFRDCDRYCMCGWWWWSLIFNINVKL